MKTYKIYQIPTFVHKNGQIGKVGCTSISIEKRALQQGHTDVILLETHTDINIANIREIELQQEIYGRRDNTQLYSQSVSNRYKFDIETARRLGSESGLKNVVSGNLELARERSRAINHSKIECPHCKLIGNYNNMKRWHYDNCKHKA